MIHHLPKSDLPCRRFLCAAVSFWAVFALTADFAGSWSTPAYQTGFLVTAAVWLLIAGFRAPAPRLHWLMAPLLFLALWGPVQILAGWSVYTFATIEESLAWSTAFAVFVLGLQLMSEGDLREKFLQGLPWFGAAVAVLAILQLLTSTGRALWLFETGYDDQVLGPFVSRNHYSAFALLIFPVAVWSACQRSRWRMVDAAASGLLFASVVAGASRAGAILMLIELAALLGYLWLRGSVRWIAPATVVSFVIAITAVIGPGTLWTRLQAAGVLGPRAAFNRSSAEMIAARPWTGFGLGTWADIYPRYAIEDVGRYVNRAHNDWAEWFADGGLPFFAALLLVALTSFVLVRGRPWGVGVPAVFLHSLVDYPLRKPAILALTLLILAALASAGRPADSQTDCQSGGRLS